MPFVIGVNVKEGTAAVDVVRRVHHRLVGRRRFGDALAKTVQGQFHDFRSCHVQCPGLHRDAQDQEGAELLPRMALQETVEADRRAVHKEPTRGEHAQEKQASVHRRQISKNIRRIFRVNYYGDG